MNIWIVCIVIAHVVISHGNVEEAGKTGHQIQAGSLLVYDQQECGYLGYTMQNGEVKNLSDPCVKWTCLANQSQLLVEG
ncbi:secreted salivary gland peptide, putative [Ixodes scapularis]|uniref:Secreted salivary gland peptide, putative n=1 Tax=Ixodes scapularis TaxID=6945 RepID=B7QHK7_IXOSC|nr:secreted salivary gland peptide, putative [Ixodes scapularis]|eukprot:XP_002414664.1 secreted salivary gland peptide, putative [Ixodes scapularis]